MSHQCRRESQLRCSPGVKCYLHTAYHWQTPKNVRPSFDKFLQLSKTFISLIRKEWRITAQISQWQQILRAKLNDSPKCHKKKWKRFDRSAGEPTVKGKHLSDLPDLLFLTLVNSHKIEWSWHRLTFFHEFDTEQSILCTQAYSVSVDDRRAKRLLDLDIGLDDLLSLVHLLYIKHEVPNAET